MSIISRSPGFSLIEAAIVLAIVGLVIGGIWIAASAVNTNLKISRTAEGVLFICTRGPQIFKAASAQAGTGADAIREEAIAAGAIPRDWVTDVYYHYKPPITNADAHLYQVQTGASPSSIAGSLMLQFQYVPVDYCAKFVSSLSAAMRNNPLIARLEMMDITEVSPININAPYTGMLSQSCQPSGATHPTTMYRIYCAPGM